jgi:hypothetical protein
LGTSEGGANVKASDDQRLLLWSSAAIVAALFVFVASPLLWRVMTNLSSSDPALLHGRAVNIDYLVSLIVPVFAAVAAVVLARRLISFRRTPHNVAVALTAGFQIAVLVLFGVIVLQQWRSTPVSNFDVSPYGQRFFTAPANILAVVGFVLSAAALVLFASRQQSVARLERFVRRVDLLFRSRKSAVISVTVIAIVTIAALSLTFYTGATIRFAGGATLAPIPYTLEELTAVFAGRSPLVNFTPQYVNGLGYLTAPYFAIFGISYATFTSVVAALSAISFASVAYVFRAASGTWARAAILYVPFLSIAMVPAYRYPGGAVHTVANYYALMPYRYFGPLVLLGAICLVMHRPSPRKWFIVGMVGGLVLANNFDFGFPAAVASLGACLVASEEGLRRSLRVAAIEAAGVLCGFVAFLLAMWAQSGSFPSLYQYVYFTLTYSAIGGADTANYQTPLVGIHLVVWFTYAACVTLPLFRFLMRTSRSDRQRLRDAAMMFVGIFGFGSGIYYVNREINVVLVGLFVTWGIAATLLTCEVASCLGRSALEHRRVHWSTILPGALCASFLFLGIGSLSDGRGIVRQWQQLFTTPQPNAFFLTPGIVSGLHTCTPPGNRVIVDIPYSYSYSTAAGVSNWMPYDNPMTVSTPSSIQHFLALASNEHVSEIYVDSTLPSTLRNTLVSSGWILSQPSISFVADPTMTLWRQPLYISAIPSACH